jgi:hypothetical protein
MWQQMRSQQAQRAADQATQVARALQSEASDARAAAERAMDGARSLEVKASQARMKADQASMGLRASESMGKAQTQMADTYSKLPETVVQSNPTVSATSVVTTAAPAETVGTVVDTTA